MNEHDLTIAIPYSLEEEVNTERERLLEFCIARWEFLFPNATLVLADDDSGAPNWSRARARNNAIAQAKTKHLVIADADTICSPQAIAEAVDFIEEKIPYAAWVLPYHQRGYYNLSQNYTEHILDRGPFVPLPPESELEYEHKLESWAGILVMTTNAFNKVGGYDERFIGWGYEDNAFRLAMDTLWTKHTRLPYYVAHLWHHAPEDVRFGQPDIGHNQRLYQKYVAAYGNIAAMRHVKGL